MKEYQRDKVMDLAKQFLDAIGEDSERQGLKETPRRIADAWKEILEGQFYTNKEIAEKYKKDFQVPYDSMVVKEVDNVYSMCEHHLLPMFNGKVYVAYIPQYWNGKDDSEGYRVIGLSKIPRIVQMCAHRLQLQEKIAADIAECIELATGSDKVYVRVIMDHCCVSMRGAKGEGVTDVTFMTPKLRNEFPELRKEIESKVQEIHLSSNK